MLEKWKSHGLVVEAAFLGNTIPILNNPILAEYEDVLNRANSSLIKGLFPFS